MNTQIITTPKGERLVVLPEAEFQALVEAAEDAADRASMHEFRAALAAGDEEMLPAAFANRIIDGENRIRVWREYRGLSAEALVEQSGVSAADLSDMETGAKPASLQAIKSIAAALRLNLDDLA